MSDQKKENAVSKSITHLLTDGNDFRKGIQKRYGKFFLWFSVVSLALAVGFLIAGLIARDVEVLRHITIGIISLWLICGIVILYIIPRQAISHFTKTTMPGICKALDPSLVYSANDGVPIEDYHASGLFPIKCCCYEHADLISGAFHGTALSFSNLQTSCKRAITRTNGKTKLMKHVQFSGIFVSCEAQKDVTGSILVMPLQEYQKLADDLADTAGPMLELKKPVDLKEIAPKEFTKQFIVFSGDEELVKKYLTQDRCTKLCTLQKQFDAPVCISYLPEHTYIAVGRMIDLSAHSIWRPLKDDELQKQYTALEQILHIPEYL